MNGPHPTWERLYAYRDAELDDPERRRIEAHIRRCTTCRGRLAEARALTRRLEALERPGRPGRDLWPGIEGRVGAPGPRLVTDEGPARESPAGREKAGGRSSGAGRRWLAAAAAILFLAGGGLLATRGGGLPGSRGGDDALATRGVSTGLATAAAVERAYRPRLARLQRRVEERSEEIGFDLAASAERDLKAIRSATEEVRSALEASAGSPELLAELEERYRRELWLLRRLAAVGST